ncbi:MAG: acyltransferase [Lachnospiraceae bacterium]|nr:acyltransferase [Lachnospiraceae bacterium]
MQYKGIDIMKFIMALFVVVLHTHPLQTVNAAADFATADVIARVAVPFFFVASGFLLEKQMSARQTEKKEILLKYAKKVLILYCIWTVIYLPIIISSKIIDSEESLVKSIFSAVRDFIFAGSYGQLWYLPAVAVGVLLVFVLRKYLGERWSAITLLILFLMGLATQSYFGLTLAGLDSEGILWKGMKAVKKVMVTCRNGVFFGGMFVYMGTWIARCNLKMKQWVVVSGLILSTILFYAEALYLWNAGSVREKDMYLMLLPTAFFCMMLALQIQTKRDTVFLRKMSINIYLVHTAFKFVYREFVGEGNESGMLLFLFTLAGSLITAYLIERMKRSKGRV